MNAAEVASIRDVRQRTMRAENEGDAAFFGQACAQDVIVLPPGMPAVVGRDAAVAFMRGFFDEFDVQIEYSSEETEVHGDIAFDRGTYTHALTPRHGGESIREVGKYLWIYSRGTDGTWRMSRVIWNAS